MTRTIRTALTAGACAAFLLVFSISSLKRAEDARERSFSWSDVERLARTGGDAAALAALDARIREHPRDALLYYYRARQHYLSGEGAPALADADRAIELGYAQEISHLLKALVRGRLYGDYAGQESLASKALSYDPTYSDGYLARAEARYALRNYRGCAADAAAYSGLEPKAAEGWEFTLLCLEAQGELAGAEAAGLKVLALKPGSHSAHWRLGRVLAARGFHKRAIKDFSEALRLSGGRSAYYLDRAASCEAEGDHSCAAWDRAAAMDWREVSDYASYYLLLGAAMHRVGELKAGLDAADAAVRLQPAAAEAYELRGRLRADSGDARGAARDFRAMAALDAQKASQARELLARLKAAEPGRSSGSK